MAPGIPAVRILLDDAQRSALAHERLGAVFGRRVRLLAGEDGQAQVRLCSLEALPQTPPGEAVVAVGDADLATVVTLMAARPWLNHVVSPSVFAGESLERALAEVLWRLLAQRRLPPGQFLGKPFRGRTASLCDSAKREGRISTIADFALAAGASAAVVERVRDVAEELISNALYDAPAELAGTAHERSTRVVLAGHDACAITYGVARDMFFVRVRDPFGSLARPRMFEVLGRCASKTAVALDVSRGGAGLGLWRIFRAACLLVLHVEPRVSTEFVVGLSLNGQDRRRHAAGGAHTIHLFFDQAESACPRGELEVMR
jgi:hypothetical protein